MEDAVSKLFIRGLNEFNSKNFYDSHEHFEDIWTNYVIEDRLFIQALIQLAVAYFHISNDNKNGAISLFKKTIGKLDNYIDSNKLILNINDVIKSTHESYQHLQLIDNMNEFNWKLAPKLEFNHDSTHR
jgi:predicted metal-dependent hydrolase